MLELATDGSVANGCVIETERVAAFHMRMSVKDRHGDGIAV